jgi:hypothetical protein
MMAIGTPLSLPIWPEDDPMQLHFGGGNLSSVILSLSKDQTPVAGAKGSKISHGTLQKIAPSPGGKERESDPSTSNIQGL